MAQIVTAETKFKNGNESFPILFEDGGLRVYKSMTNEIFVEDIRSGVTIQISSSAHSDGGLRFITEGRVESIGTHNMAGWRVGR